MKSALGASDAPQKVGRATAHTQNPLEVARFSGLRTDDEPAPYEVVAERAVFRMRGYDLVVPSDGPQTPPLMPDPKATDPTLEGAP